MWFVWQCRRGAQRRCCLYDISVLVCCLAARCIAVYKHPTSTRDLSAALPLLSLAKHSHNVLCESCVGVKECPRFFGQRRTELRSVVKYIYLAGRGGTCTTGSAQPGMVTKYNAPVMTHSALHAAHTPVLGIGWVTVSFATESQNVSTTRVTLLSYSAFCSCVPTSCC